MAIQVCNVSELCIFMDTVVMKTYYMLIVQNRRETNLNPWGGAPQRERQKSLEEILSVFVYLTKSLPLVHICLELPGLCCWPTYLYFHFRESVWTVNFYSFQKQQMPEFCMAFRQQMRLYITCSKSCTSLDQTQQKMHLLLKLFLALATLTSQEGYLRSNYRLYDTL